MPKTTASRRSRTEPGIWAESKSPKVSLSPREFIHAASLAIEQISCAVRAVGDGHEPNSKFVQHPVDWAKENLLKLVLFN